MRDTPALRRLVADGLLRREGERFRTTRRWQAAMARAALLLLRSGQDLEDLRLPIACALVDLYGAAAPDGEIAERVAVLLPIEAAELDPPRAPPEASDCPTR